MRNIVDLCHTFDFGELDIVTILVRMSLVFVDVDCWVLALLDAANDELLCLFSILVSHKEFRSVVQESITGQSQVLRENIANSILSAKFVDLDQSVRVPEVLSNANHIKLVNHVVVEFVCDLNIDVRVQFLQLSDRCLSSCLVSNVSFTDIEVRTHISDAHLRRVIDCDRFGASEDQVLCNFYAKAAHTNDKNFHLDELAHGFDAEGSDLPRVEVRVDLWFCLHHSYLKVVVVVESFLFLVKRIWLFWI